MKTLEKPFAISAYEKLEQVTAEYLKAHKRYEDLCFIRKAIAEGRMTEKLYDFINTDGSMENLLCGLPRPSDDITCEALTLSQLKFMDANIQVAEEGLRDFLKMIWEAFKQWFLDWWDRNRFEYRQLRRMLALHQTNPAAFGSSATFDSTTVYSYSLRDWNKLLDAAKNLNEVVKSVPNDPSKLKDWIEKSKPVVTTNLAEFGKYIDEFGFIRDGNPKYNKASRTCVSGRWEFEGIRTYLNNAVNALDDEIKFRKQFNDMEHLFTSADPTDKKSFMFTKKLVVRTKEQVLHVGRSLRLMLSAVQRAAVPGYTIPKA